MQFIESIQEENMIGSAKKFNHRSHQNQQPLMKINEVEKYKGGETIQIYPKMDSFEFTLGRNPQVPKQLELNTHQ